MLFRVFAKEELARLFEVLSYSCIVGPTQKAVDQFGEPIYNFAHLEDFSDLALDYPTTAHSPKRYFLPHTQTIGRYAVEACHYQEIPLNEPESPLVFFGMHACDINGLNRLDRILLRGGTVNRHYAVRRRNTFIIGVSCIPSPNCFCRSMGCDTVLHGCDMFLTYLEDEIFCEIRSAPAWEVMKELHSREADSHDHSRYVRHGVERESRFSQEVDTTDLLRILDMEFEAEIWQEWGRPLPFMWYLCQCLPDLLLLWY
jgi:hypothetical protein